jgi:hypothetical protein
MDLALCKKCKKHFREAQRPDIILVEGLTEAVGRYFAMDNQGDVKFIILFIKQTNLTVCFILSNFSS